ncbi:MAG: leucine--tRNA ligase [Patescibacteria group bacterium]
MDNYNPKKIEEKWPFDSAQGKQVYGFKAIEKKWQDIWEKNQYGIAADFSDNPKHYHLVEFPYPSGEGLHVGHCMGYGASDAYCRMKRMQGFNVMYPIGWDAFGLPTENYAIKTGKKPVLVTKENTDNFRKQMKSLGYAFDWDREVNTTDPAYYKWTQWIFLQFYKHAIIDDKLVEVADDDTETPRLAYQAEMPINWCPSCKIGLANEEVIAGKCERCGSETIKKMQKQWMLRITAYAERLIKDLDTVEYLDKIKTQQVNWIGRSTGSNIVFRIQNADNSIEVFTTRADTLFGCTYVVLSPEHLLIKDLKDKIQNYKEVEKYVQDAAKKSDLERVELDKEKTGVRLEGIKAINPINNEEVDIWVADYVLATYGTGAVMAVPAHDERDFEFAKKYGIPVKQVISKDVEVPAAYWPQAGEKPKSDNNKAYTGPGYLFNSGEFNNLSSEEAKKKITEKLKSIGVGDFSVNFKLRDWVFSRQHYWGEPIPIVHCQKCGMVPLQEKDLPLTLPDVKKYEPTNTGESPLADISDWVNVKCPKCGGDAKRETDTMPNWAGSSWYFLAYAMNADIRGNIFDENKKELNYWFPVDLYNGGMEHTTLHLLYSRFWHKFLYDLGKVPTLEPYQKRIAHGIILGPDGQKMSKSRGNVINPDSIVEQYGADTLRAYIMFIGPYDQESAWSTAGVQGVSRFLKRVWNNFGLIKDDANDSKTLLVKLNQTIKGVSDDIDNFRFNTVVSKLMELNNVIEKEKTISKKSFSVFLQLLYPVVPHLASELYEKLTKSDISKEEWPKPDVKYLKNDTIEIVVQVNGKVRDKIIVDSEIDDEKLKETALNSERVQQYIAGHDILKTIVVPKKLVSVVIK